MSSVVYPSERAGEHNRLNLSEHVCMYVGLYVSRVPSQIDSYGQLLMNIKYDLINVII